jgi:hypothetical protein
MRFLYAGIAFGIFTGGFYFINDYRKVQTNSGPIDQNKNSNTYRNNSSIHLQPPQLNSAVPHKKLKPQFSLNKETYQQPTSAKKQGITATTINAPNSAISVGQTGGVTAHTVNIGQQERKITADQQQILINRLKTVQVATIKVDYSKGIPEENHFAQSIIAALKAAGCNVVDTADMQQLFTPYGNGLHVVINNNKPPYPKGAVALQRAFMEAKIDAYWYGQPEMRNAEIWIYVGPMP